MSRFSCPSCEKGLRADESKAGSVVKCPACGHKLTIPSPAAEPPPEDEAPDPVEPRKRKRRRLRDHARSAAAKAGKVPVLVIIGLVVAMHLLSLGTYLLEYYRIVRTGLQFQQAQEISRGLGTDLKKVPRRLEMVMSRPEMQQRLRLANWLALSWLLASFAVSVVLLLFLYLGHDWARLALGSLCLIAGFWALFGCIFGGMAALMFPSGIGALLALLEMLFRLGVNFGVGAALMRSESIAAYTAGR